MLFDKLVGLLSSELKMPVGDAKLKVIAGSIISRLDLVSREEFDAQCAVLERTQEKLRKLEAELSNLSSS
jgi:BMFP domain-containing protein YqiC